MAALFSIFRRLAPELALAGLALLAVAAALALASAAAAALTIKNPVTRK